MKSSLLHSIPSIQTVLLAIGIVMLLQPSYSFAQLAPVPIDENVSTSDLIIEGEVLHSLSFWDGRRQNIYTSHLIRVYKVFKGVFQGSVLEIITPGGVVGEEMHRFSPGIELRVGDLGIFLCRDSRIRNSGRPIDSDIRVELHSGPQGFLGYDRRTRTVSGPFDRYDDFEFDLYPVLINLTGRPFEVIGDLVLNPGNGFTGKGMRLLATPTITSFTPTSISAGTATTLTINGTNFGATTGTVEFRNADDGGASWISALSSQILSWTDLQILVQVTAEAGTGQIRVTNADPASVTSSGTLTITYAQLNYVDAGNALIPDHIDDNANGGLTYNMNTAFADTASREAAFVRAMETWRCTTASANKVNWDLGGETTLNVTASDGVNIVRMAGAAELGSGTLAVHVSRWNICSGTIMYLVESDLSFNPNYSWYYGTGSPGGSQYDFESVALHELGHAMQLGHANGTSQVLYYSIGAGSTNRSLHSNDVAGGDYVMTQSYTANACGPGPMTTVSAEAGDNVSICPASSTQLNAAGGITYSWTPTTGLSDATIPNPVATPAATTTYTVLVGNGSCYSSSDNMTVTVRTPPTAVAGNDELLCLGDSVTIGSSSSSPSTYSFGTWDYTQQNYPYATANQDNRTQMLYLASELTSGGMSAGVISKFALYLQSTSGGIAMQNFAVKMFTTSRTNLSTGFTSGSKITVYSSTAYTPAGTGWQTLDFTAGFPWDGSSNIVVEICFDNTTAGSNFRIRAESTSPNYMLTYYRGSGSGCSESAMYINYARPMVQFTVMPKWFSWTPTTGLSSPIVSNPDAFPSTTSTYTLTTTDGYGCTGSDQTTVTVYPADPTNLTWDGEIDTDWSTVGNWDSPCAIPNTGDQVTIPAGPTPPSGSPSLSLSDFTMSNATGMTLSGDMTLTNQLTLTSGTITLGSNNLSIGSSGSISGGSSSSFIVSNSTGELRQDAIGSSGRSGAVLFPVGSSTASYTPVTITNSGTDDEFRVRVTNAILTGGTGGSPITANVVEKTWHIAEATGGGSSAAVTVQWNGVDEASPSFDRTDCFIAHFGGVSWAALQSSGAAGGSDPYTRTATGITTFSPFGIGDSNSPLPVELVSFSARRTGDAVKLSWRTATETNSDRFEVERKIEGGSWQTIGLVAAQGISARPMEYSLMDENTPDVTALTYRLKQVDRDGSYSYSSEFTVQLGKFDRFTLAQNYPNPFNTSTAISFTNPSEGFVSVKVYDVQGRLVRDLASRHYSEGSHMVIFSAGTLPQGIYTCIVSNGTDVRSGTMLLTR